MGGIVFSVIYRFICPDGRSYVGSAYNSHLRSVLRKWKARQKAKAVPAEDKPASPFEKLKIANVGLQEELHQLKKNGDGNLFAKDDTAKNIAVAIIGTFDGSPNKLTKVEGVAREMLAWVKAQPKPKQAASKALTWSKAGSHGWTGKGGDDPLLSYAVARIQTGRHEGRYSAKLFDAHHNGTSICEPCLSVEKAKAACDADYAEGAR